MGMQSGVNEFLKQDCNRFEKSKWVIG